MGKKPPAHNAPTRKRDGEDAPRITDPRFAAVHSDPRFQKMPKSKRKLAVDKRFENMFTDKEFVEPSGVDKRGGPRKKKNKKLTLQRYYRLEDEDLKVEGDGNQVSEGGEVEDAGLPSSAKVNVDHVDDNEDEDEDDSDEKKQASSFLSSSSEEDQEDSSSSSSSEDEESDAEMAEDESEDEKVATTETETRRLAAVNLDWTHLAATDLLVVFNSFIPKTGCIESVTVYPTQYGLEQMKEESVRGPSALKEIDEGGDDDNQEYNQEKLREYERSRLGYYFAVVVCDTVETASHLYKACDGLEFDRSSNMIDLRFIPDDRKFEVEPRDTATQAPADYEAPEFCTSALQLTNVKLTWEDDEPTRMKTLRRTFNADEINEDDFKAYLASDDDEEEEEEEEAVDKEERIKKYKALLLGNDEDEKQKEGDLEVTFQVGLEELNKKFLEKKNKDEETVWDAYLRKKKEKKKSRKQEEEPKSRPNDVAGNDDEFDDPFFASEVEAADMESDEETVAEKVKKTKDVKGLSREERLERKKDEERSKAELELLMMDDENVAAGESGGGKVKGYNLKLRGKNKERQRDRDAREEQVQATADYNDPRFSSLFTSPMFAIDPTDPQYKRSKNKLRVVAELQQQLKARPEEPAPAPAPEENSRKRKQELLSTVRSLKRKMK